jgi:GMP synthase (glutamine-hydrolysing)
LGDITPEKILQDVDKVFIDNKILGLYAWRCRSNLPVNSVGVMGDERTYEK